MLNFMTFHLTGFGNPTHMLTFPAKIPCISIAIISVAVICNLHMFCIKYYTCHKNLTSAAQIFWKWFIITSYSCSYPLMTFLKCAFGIGMQIEHHNTATARKLNLVNLNIVSVGCTDLGEHCWIVVLILKALS